MSKLQIVERRVDEVTVLVLTGEIVLDDGDLAFRKQIHDLVGQGRVRIVVDLGSVTYIDSAGVGMMAAKMKTVRESGGAMKLVNLTSRGQRLLAMMKLMSVFEVFEDEASAIRSFSWGVGG
jgi:anti-sigma B factor antagonist